MKRILTLAAVLILYVVIPDTSTAQTFSFVQADTLIRYEDVNHTYYFRAQVTNLLPSVRTLRYTLMPYQYPDTARQSAICTFLGCYPPRSGPITIDQEYEASQQDDSVKFYIYNQISDWSQGFPIPVEDPLDGDYILDVTVQNLDNLNEQISFRLSLLFGVGVVQREQLPLPVASALVSNFPNPFNAGTTIRFDVNSTATVALTVFDLLGREVAQPLNPTNMSAGRYQVNWAATSSAGTDLPTGRYVVRAQIGAQAHVLPVTLIR